MHHHLIGPLWGNVVIIALAGADYAWPVSWRCSGCCFVPAKPTGTTPSTPSCATIAEESAAVDKPRVRVYLDDNPQPIIDQELPTEVILDTRSLEDGPHRLVIRAQDQNGREGIEEIPFRVHNGPGIIVSGLRPAFDSARQGALYHRCIQHRRSVRSASRRSAFVDSGLGLGDVVVRRRVGGLVRRTHVGCAGGILADAHLQQSAGDTCQIAESSGGL